MYSQEGEFDECVKRVRQQVDVDVTHFVIAGYNEQEAHNALWDEWNKCKNDHDLFVKVDADTILMKYNTLSCIAELFKANPRITGLQAPLFDYMTDAHINGLNVFSPKVTFRQTQDGLYCDRGVDIDHDIVLREAELPQSLRPAGTHCAHCTDRQAFHFGLHRALKNQQAIIFKVTQAWMKHHDRPRAFALLGAHARDKFSSGQNFNYCDEQFIAAFEDAKKQFEG